MVRPHVPERDHFTKVKDVPKSKGSYWYYKCKHCTKAYNKDPNLDPPELLVGRADNYIGHLRKCTAYQTVVEASQRHSSHSDSSEGSVHQQRRPVNTRLVITKASPRRNTSKRSSPKPSSQRRLSKLQKQELERKLVEVQAGNFLPDLFIERSCTIALLEFLWPGITANLPSRRVMCGRIPKSHAAHCRAIQTENLKEEQSNTGGFVNVLSDILQNVSREHIMGCQLLLFVKTLTYALPKTGSRHDGVAMAQEMESILNQGFSDGWTIGAVITDNAGQCGRARRILALRWPNIIFLFCFAYCINNIVKAVLKSSFSDVAKEATAAVKCLNASSAKWLVRARVMMQECYNKPLALFTLCETRWNSVQSCLASLLRVRTSLEMLGSKYGAYKDFPSSFKVFTNPTFWRKFSEAELVIAPISEASYRLQRDENTLADVVLSFRDIFCGFHESHLDCRSDLIKCIEDRWEQCEQPLFLLTFVLNPATADEGPELVKQTDERKRVLEPEERVIGRVLDGQVGLPEYENQQHLRASKNAAKIASSTQLAKFAVYYYHRLIGDDFDCIRSDLMGWMENTLTSCHPKEFRFNVVRFWQHIKKENPTSVLPDLAIKLLSFAVNTATTERLFSKIGMIHTPKRNKLTPSKAMDIQCIRQYMRECDKKMLNLSPRFHEY